MSNIPYNKKNIKNSVGYYHILHKGHIYCAGKRRLFHFSAVGIYICNQALNGQTFNLCEILNMDRDNRRS